MKKIQQPIHAHLLPAKLFLDDLEEIDEILKESGLSYKLTLDEYELDSVYEIQQIEEKQNFNKLEITLNERFFNLSIDGYMTYIYSPSNSLYVGITEKIKPIIQKRKQIYGFIELGLVIFNMLLVFSNLLNMYYHFYSDLIQNMVSVTMLLLSIRIVVSSLGNKKSKFIAFTTKRSNEKNNYFTKNKEQLLTNSIINIINIIIGGIGVTVLRFLLTGQF